MELFSRFMAITMILFLSPLFIILCIGSLIFQGYPIIFRQERIGFKFKPFILYKFRSMINNSMGRKVTDINDKRITLWGNLIRKFKLDELPQLWNIVKGEMRFIGPRPEVEEYIKNEDFGFLWKVKPGLTDFASILFRNEASILSSTVGVENYQKLLTVKLELGQLYAKRKSFWLDIELLFITLLSIISPKMATAIIIRGFIMKYKPSIISVIEEWI